MKPEEISLQTMKFYNNDGCRRCNETGYKGRIGIYEVLEIDTPLINLINQRATVEDIRNYATKNNMITMLQDGIVKAKKGITTIEEVLRVTRE